MINTDQIGDMLTTLEMARRRELHDAESRHAEQASELRARVEDLEREVRWCRNHIEFLNERLDRLKRLERGWAEFRFVVADCQQWFTGFLAAYAGREAWDRPAIPNLGTMRDLNLALLQVDPDQPMPAKGPEF